MLGTGGKSVLHQKFTLSEVVSILYLERDRLRHWKVGLALQNVIKDLIEERFAIFGLHALFTWRCRPTLHRQTSESMFRDNLCSSYTSFATGFPSWRLLVSSFYHVPANQFSLTLPPSANSDPLPSGVEPIILPHCTDLYLEFPPTQRFHNHTAI